MAQNLSLKLLISGDSTGAINAVRVVSSEIDKAERSTKTLANEGVRASASMRQGFENLGSVMSSVLGVIGIGSLGALGARVVQTTQTLQDMQTRLRGLTQGAADYAETERYLTSLADEHHKSQIALADSYTKLLVLEQSGLIVREQSRAILEGLSNVQTKTGASTEQLKQSMFGLTQALSKGVLQAEEFNQIFEPLPGLVQAVERANGLAIGSFRQLATEGKISGEMLTTYLVAGLREYEGTAKSAAGTITASYADIENAWLKLVRAVESPVAGATTWVLSLPIEAAKEWDIFFANLQEDFSGSASYGDVFGKAVEQALAGAGSAANDLAGAIGKVDQASKVLAETERGLVDVLAATEQGFQRSLVAIEGQGAAESASGIQKSYQQKLISLSQYHEFAIALERQHQERLVLLAEQSEAIQAENTQYAQRLAQINAQHQAGEITQRVHNLMLEGLERTHQQNMMAIAAETEAQMAALKQSFTESEIGVELERYTKLAEFQAGLRASELESLGTHEQAKTAVVEIGGTAREQATMDSESRKLAIENQSYEAALQSLQASLDAGIISEEYAYQVRDQLSAKHYATLEAMQNSHLVTWEQYLGKIQASAAAATSNVTQQFAGIFNSGILAIGSGVNLGGLANMRGGGQAASQYYSGLLGATPSRQFLDYYKVRNESLIGPGRDATDAFGQNLPSYNAYLENQKTDLAAKQQAARAFASFQEQLNASNLSRADKERLQQTIDNLMQEFTGWWYSGNNDILETLQLSWTSGSQDIADAVSSVLQDAAEDLPKRAAETISQSTQTIIDKLARDTREKSRDVVRSIDEQMLSFDRFVDKARIFNATLTDTTDAIVQAIGNIAKPQVNVNVTATGGTQAQVEQMGGPGNVDIVISRLTQQISQGGSFAKALEARYGLR